MKKQNIKGQLYAANFNQKSFDLVGYDSYIDNFHIRTSVQDELPAFKETGDLVSKETVYCVGGKVKH